MVLVVKTLPVNAGDPRDADSIPGLGRSLGGGHGNLLQYSCPGEALWTAEPGRLQSMGSQGVAHDGSDLAHDHATLLWDRTGEENNPSLLHVAVQDAPQSWEGSAGSTDDGEAQAGSGKNGSLSTWTVNSVLGASKTPL